MGFHVLGGTDCKLRSICLRAKIGELIGWHESIINDTHDTLMELGAGV